MKIFSKILSMAAVALSVASCSLEVIDTDDYRPEQIVKEVSFSIPTDGTRAMLGEDGATTNWELGDAVYLWAEDVNGGYVAENVKFMLRYFSPEYSEAFFSGDMPMMAEGEYRYTLAFPAPKSVNGSQISYTLPATQDGFYSDDYDVMVASNIIAPQITGEEATRLDAVMEHRMHALKITIPESSNHFGSRVERLELTFPNPVVGDMVIDLSDPDAEPTYVNTSNTITLARSGGFDFDTPIWVFVLPGTVDGDVSYNVRSQISISKDNSFAVSRHMKAGHVTPIRMATPAVDLYTTISFSVGANNLGEAFNSFSIYDVNQNNKAIATFARNADNHYTLNIPNTASYEAWQNGSFRVVYDSAHAVVESSVQLGTLTPFADNAYTINVPYLFEEDFSNIDTFGDGHDAPETGFSGDSQNYSSAFSSYTSNPRMADWTGGRYQCSKGSIRTVCRSETALTAIKHYRGRIDSAPMSGLKNGASVKVKVTFNYASAWGVYTLSGKINGNTLMTFGYTTTSGVISPTTNVSNVLINARSVSENTGSFTNVPSSAEATIPSCTKATRLSWLAASSAKSSGFFASGNANSWLYIDNIRVSIVQ